MTVLEKKLGKTWKTQEKHQKGKRSKETQVTSFV